MHHPRLPHMADIENLLTAPHAEDSVFADPSGWTSDIATPDNIKHVLCSTLGVQTSDIENILEEKDLDHFIFTSRCSGSDVFYLFSGGSTEIYEVVKPSTQKELWGVLQYDDWRDRLALKEL
ncbi:hypothetical protein JVT61DRAFT_14557 [Boletus reticuloceps]|uniref:Uncharacterized protein n=1 Tax=Boletus reticuloceps TaxID=495285 RepID=A0A8I2YR68_9AGAM|nr:hypothetical protein JVT61DRAFT_14557 [Boletus reticuloceps]